MFEAKLMAVPDYSSAVERLTMFVAEDIDWDGYGGLPASSEVEADILKFLPVAQSL